MHDAGWMHARMRVCRAWGDSRVHVCAAGLARTGNYMGMNEAELNELQTKDPEQYARMMKRSYDILSNAGAHYVVDDITGLPRIIDDINRRLVTRNTCTAQSDTGHRMASHEA